MSSEITLTLKITDMKNTGMKIKLSISLLLTLLAFNSLAETVYIDDNQKFVWTRTGPSEDFKVRENVVTSQLEVLQRNEETGFVQVKDERGNTFWVKSKYLTGTPSARHKLKDAEDNILSLTQKYKSKISTLEKRVQDLAPLETFNQELQTKLATQEAELETLRQKAQMYQDGFNSEMLFAGSLVVLGGMFVGWLLSKLGGRRRNSGWG